MIKFTLFLNGSIKIATELSDLMGILVTVDTDPIAGAKISCKGFSRCINIHETYIAFKIKDRLSVVQFTNEVALVCMYYESLNKE